MFTFQQDNAKQIARVVLVLWAKLAQGRDIASKKQVEK